MEQQQGGESEMCSARHLWVLGWEVALLALLITAGTRSLRSCQCATEGMQRIKLQIRECYVVPRVGTVLHGMHGRSRMGQQHRLIHRVSTHGGNTKGAGSLL